MDLRQVTTDRNLEPGAWSLEAGAPIEDPATRAATRRVGRIVAVGGGKGGSGKSLIAANVAIFLATLDKRVVLFDADLGGANLHTFVGVERPTVTLADFLEKDVERIEDVVVETAIPGLGLVSGEGGPPWIANPKPAQKFRVLNQLARLDADFLVVDLGPGSGFNALDFFNVADVGVLVVLPEPTSVENTHRFIKSAFLRQLKKHGLEKVGELLRLKKAGEHFEGGIPAPRDLYRMAQDHMPELAEPLLVAMRKFRPRILVNQVRTRADSDLAQHLVTAARRRLGVPLEVLGHLEHDDAAWAAVRRRRPLLVEYPESRVAKGLERVARRLLALDPNAESTGEEARSLDQQTLYEVLDVDPTSSEEDIRRAYRRGRDIYAPDSMVVSGLYNQERLEALHLRIEEAYGTLMDPDRRKGYDRETFPQGLPHRDRTPAVGVPVAKVTAESSGRVDAHASAAASHLPATADRPPVPEIGPDTVLTGELMRQVRAARGLELFDVSETTKIAMSHLRDLEDERFDRLPALVYVRGYLKAFARSIGIDASDALVATYLDRFKAAKGAGSEGN